MKVSVPATITARVASYGTQLAREAAFARGWKSGSSFYPASGTGFAAVKTKKKYLMYQEHGTRPFLMTKLEGKTVPINGPGGLRFVKVVGVGQPGWVTLPGGVRKWRDQKWRHPGIKPTNMMAESINRSMIFHRPLIKKYVNQIMGGYGPQ